MKTKANALLLCILMIASTLAGCAGDDVEVIKTLEQADCDAIGEGYTLDSDHNVCVKEVTVTETVTDIVGCMDAAADNYNSAANVAGDCVFGGCDDSEASNYNPDAAIDDDSCEYICVLGDMNCDGEINILDAVIAINLIFAHTSQKLL